MNANIGNAKASTKENNWRRFAIPAAEVNQHIFISIFTTNQIRCQRNPIVNGRFSVCFQSIQIGLHSYFDGAQKHDA